MYKFVFEFIYCFSKKNEYILVRNSHNVQKSYPTVVPMFVH